MFYQVVYMNRFPDEASNIISSKWQSERQLSKLRLAAQASSLEQSYSHIVSFGLLAVAAKLSQLRLVLSLILNLRWCS